MEKEKKRGIITEKHLRAKIEAELSAHNAEKIVSSSFKKILVFNTIENHTGLDVHNLKIDLIRKSRISLNQRIFS